PAGAPIDEHEGLGARGRDPDAEALYVVIVNDAVAGLRGAQPLDYLICELHPPAPHFLCPRHVHRTLLERWQRMYAHCLALAKEKAYRLRRCWRKVGKEQAAQRGRKSAKGKLLIKGSWVRIPSGSPNKSKSYTIILKPQIIKRLQKR